METVKKAESNRLIILDFAGTLSIQTVLFGRKDRLARALRTSGLAQLGFRDPTMFWEELVFPTWEEGGLTSKGYAEVLAQRIGELLSRDSLPFMGRLGKKFVHRSRYPFLIDITYRFVQLYFQNSRIDPGWKALLKGPYFKERMRSDEPLDTFLIATDHYAECTAFLRCNLRRWGIRSTPIRRGIYPEQACLSQNTSDSPSLSPKPTPIVFIANSADLGCWKKDPAFWEQVNKKLPLKTFQRILLIDDFGHNEHRGDPYSDRQRIEQRRDSILRCLASFSPAKVEVFPFFLESPVSETPPADIYLEYRRLLDEALLFFRNHW